MSNLIDHLYSTAPFMFNGDESGKSGNGVHCGCGEEFVATHDEITGPIDAENNTNHLAYERLAVHIAEVAASDSAAAGKPTPKKAT